MVSHRHLAIALFAGLLIWPSAFAAAQGGSDRFFQMMDRNRDGVLEGDELSRIPQQMRDAMGGKGRITPQDFAQAVEQMRSSRGGGGFGRGGGAPGGFGGGAPGGFGGGAPGGFSRGGGAPGGFGGGAPGGFSRGGGAPGGFGGGAPGGFSRGGGVPGEGFDRGRGGDRRGGDAESGGRFGTDRNRDGAQPGQSTGGTPQPVPRQPITIDLPSAFAEGDIDQDGQIGMYEWRRWKSRAAFAEFMAMDINRDGFLTPRELVMVEKVGLENLMPKQESTEVASSTATGSAPSESSNGSGGSPYGSSSGSPYGSSDSGSSNSSSSSSSSAEERARSIAARYFKILDSNKSGSIEPDEWDRSKRLKPKFEESGADLSKPMSEEDFMTIYMKTN